MQRPFPSLALVLALASSLPAQAAEPLLIRPLAERRVATLPDGPLSWRIENAPSVAAANAVAGPWSLVVESAGKVWLFTLGAPGGSTPNMAKVTEVGPIPRIAAKDYLLRINDASGPPGSVTPVHSHPGSEALYVLEGQQTIRGLHDALHVDAGRGEPGHGADQAMQVSSSGTVDLHSLVMFVVDAERPFSSPATLPASP